MKKIAAFLTLALIAGAAIHAVRGYRCTHRRKGDNAQCKLEQHGPEVHHQYD